MRQRRGLLRGQPRWVLHHQHPVRADRDGDIHYVYQAGCDEVTDVAAAGVEVASGE